MSPRDIGRGLAISLDTSCRADEISRDERSLAQAARIPIERYYSEVLVLSGFAQDYAIFLAGSSETGKEVLSGYREAWANVGKSGAAGAALFRLFITRCPEYAKAVRADEGASKHGAATFSQLSLALGQNIRTPDCSAAEGGSAEMLAMTFAHVYYSSHYEGTAEVLKSAKLIA